MIMKEPDVSLLYYLWVKGPYFLELKPFLKLDMLYDCVLYLSSVPSNSGYRGSFGAFEYVSIESQAQQS